MGLRLSASECLRVSQLDYVLLILCMQVFGLLRVAGGGIPGGRLLRRKPCGSQNRSHRWVTLTAFL